MAARTAGLPAAPSEPKLLGDETGALKAVMRKLDRGHPLETGCTRRLSYHVATSMLAGISTPDHALLGVVVRSSDTRYAVRT
jgi:hypothetical protein